MTSLFPEPTAEKLFGGNGWTSVWMSEELGESQILIQRVIKTGTGSRKVTIQTLPVDKGIQSISSLMVQIADISVGDYEPKTATAYYCDNGLGGEDLPRFTLDGDLNDPTATRGFPPAISESSLWIVHRKLTDRNILYVRQGEVLEMLGIDLGEVVAGMDVAEC